jgi:hypothetical protein
MFLHWSRACLAEDVAREFTVPDFQNSKRMAHGFGESLNLWRAAPYMLARGLRTTAEPFN